MEIQLWGLLLFAILIVGGICVGLMGTAFGIVIWRGSWEAAMRRVDNGKWPLARKLMATGAGLGTIFGFLFLLLMEWGKRLFDQ